MWPQIMPGLDNRIRGLIKKMSTVIKPYMFTYEQVK